MDKLVEELDRYADGTLTSFSVPLDMYQGTEFQRRVWQALRQIPYGEVRSYADIAAAVGNPLAARAVGSANKRNRIPILIPCHRVIHKDGSIGGFNSGVHIKERLLALERVRL